MFKPEELLLREIWTFVLSKLSTEDKLSCRCVCNSLKKEVDSILSKNQDRLWLRLQHYGYEHYFCYDKDHTISSRDTLYFDKTISIKNLQFLSKLMPSLKILKVDPLDQVYRETYLGYMDLYCDKYLLTYRDKQHRTVPITKIFPQVPCLILPGATKKENFVGDLSQVKHLTLFDGVQEGLPNFPNLDSLEVRTYTQIDYGRKHLPMPSKRFVVPDATIQWKTLPKTLEVIETQLNCKGYISVGKPHFDNLKILKNPFAGRYDQNENLNTLINFLKDHKESLTELSFSVDDEVANIKVLLPLLTNLQKLSVEIKTDKQAIEFKEIKSLAYNLQYFELSFDFLSGNEQGFGAILENLPTGVDNLSIENVWSYRQINTFMEEIIEKVVNGDTTRVTIADVDTDEYTNEMIEEIVKMKPEPVRVEKRNSRVLEQENEFDLWTKFNKCICDIVISV